MRVVTVARICKILPDVTLPGISLQQQLNLWIRQLQSAYPRTLHRSPWHQPPSMGWILENGGYLHKDLGEQASAARGRWERLVCLGHEDRH